jgi:predicted lipoprotein with Yx(FWY)xxD motif
MVRVTNPLARGSGRLGSRPRTMRILGTALSGLAAAGVLAACGTGGGSTGSAGGYGGGGGSTGAGGSSSAPANGAAVSAHQMAGVGTVLVDSSGKTIYSPEQDANGKIQCTGSCLSFWFPVKAPAGAALSATKLPGLGTIHRPDNGVTQVTFDGKPLYTFRLDTAPGQIRGNNFTDSFGGTSFNWLAVTTSGAPSGPSPGSSSSSPGGGYSGGGSGGGY